MPTPPEAANASTAPPKSGSNATRAPIYLAAAVVAVCTILLHVSSFRWSPSLTLCDVDVTCDEGLVAMNLPLTRLTASGKPATDVTIYKRDDVIWTAGAAGKTPLRSWMAMLDQVRCDGAMFADFGYWKGAWKSEARPGPFIVVFAPVWFIGLATFGLFLLLYYKLIQFRLRTLFVLITICGVIAWLLTLRAPAQ